jgi:hypothetical protein
MAAERLTRIRIVVALSFEAGGEPSRQEGVAAVPFHRAAVEEAPFRLEVGAEGHQSQAVVEVRHPTPRMERVQRLCFCVVLRM